MKLAFCLFKYFPYGGLQRDFLRIVNACLQRGHEIHVYTMKWEGEPCAGVHLHIIQSVGRQNHTRIRAFAEQVQAQLAGENFDLIIGFNKMPGLDFYYAADVCYQARVHERHGWLYRLLPRYRQYIAFEKAVFDRGKHTEILLIAARQQAEFTHYYHTEAQRFHCLSPGIARDRIAPANAAEIRARVRAELSITPQDFLLLMVGSGFKTKGLDRALAAIAALPAALRARCQLLVIGQDEAASFLRLAKRLQIADRVRFLGGRSDVADFLLAADLLLHPAYHENTGTVLLEAMVSGLPVLTSDACGYAHYVADAKAGVVLPLPFQQADMNSALQTMLLAPERSQWQQNGLAFAKNADIYSLPERVVDLLEAAKQKPLAPVKRSFEQMMLLRGECFREQEGRLTQRVNLGNKSYFIKQHTGVGWKEIFKNLLQFRLPILGAKNEWLALQKLERLGIPVPALIAYEQRGLNPARLQSYVLMEDLTSPMSLEDLSKTWQKTPPSFQLKKKIIAEVARIARIMHQHGINHRDFYICHFLLKQSTLSADTEIKLHLIDLHRAQIRRLTPERWIIKDLAGLYFSSKESRLTLRDLYRFMQIYRGKTLREILASEKVCWQKVKNRGEKLYREHA